MIVAPLLGAALVVNVATSPLTGPEASEANLTLQQKAAATEPLVRSATDCIVRAVIAINGVRTSFPFSSSRIPCAAS